MKPSKFRLIKIAASCCTRIKRDEKYIRCRFRSQSEKRPTNSPSSSYRILIRPHPNLGFFYLPDPFPPDFADFPSFRYVDRNQCAVSLFAHPFLPVFLCSEKGKREKCTCAVQQWSCAPPPPPPLLLPVGDRAKTVSPSHSYDSHKKVLLG